MDSTSAQLKRPRTGSVPAQMPAQPGVAPTGTAKQQQQQLQQSQAADAVYAESGLAGLLGRLPDDKSG